MTATVDPYTVTEAGVWPDMPPDVYLADPVDGGSLSNSGAKLLLPPSCPAKFRWYADHGQPRKEAFDFGHAAHRMVLGVGPDITPVPFDDWRTKAAREAREKAYEAGQVPVLAADYVRVLAMADALQAHPLAAALLSADTGPVEQSLFWVDRDTAVMRRARLDKIRYSAATSGRTVVVDYKSCASADPEACAKAMHNYGYNRQAAWYIDGAVTLGLGGEDTAFVLVFQEKEPPYLVGVYEPDPVAVRAGRDHNRQALEVFAECQTTGVWPGYADDVIPLPLPPYAERRYLEESLA